MVVGCLEVGADVGECLGVGDTVEAAGDLVSRRGESHPPALTPQLRPLVLIG